nr:hypothetical protein [uncultured Methanolobus sp.]
MTNCLAGCIDQNSVKESSMLSDTSKNIKDSANDETSNIEIDYSTIELLPPYNKSKPDWLKTNTSNIAKIVLENESAKQLILEGGTIVGVTYSCHPTSENYEGPGCAPALKIESGNRIVDFLVDEEKGTVIETVTEITSA